MIKSISLLLFNSLFFYSCNNSTIKKFDCEAFLKGDFVYKKQAKFYDAKINIKDDVHTEIYDDSTFIISKIVWTDKCSYYMKVIEVRGSEYIQLGDIMKVNIVKIKNNEITYKAKYKGVDLQEKLIKVESKNN